MRPIAAPTSTRAHRGVERPAPIQTSLAEFIERDGFGVRQPFDDLDTLLDEAQQTQERLNLFLKQLSTTFPGSRIVLPPEPKPRAVIRDLVDTRWGGDPSRITDYARGMLLLPNEPEERRALAALKAGALDLVVVMDNMKHPKPDGYRDYKVLFRDPANGFIGELLVTTQRLNAYLDTSHAYFDETRALKTAAAREGRPLTVGEQARVAELEALSRSGWERAHQLSTDPHLDPEHRRNRAAVAQRATERRAAVLDAVREPTPVSWQGEHWHAVSLDGWHQLELHSTDGRRHRLVPLEQLGGSFEALLVGRERQGPFTIDAVDGQLLAAKPGGVPFVVRPGDLRPPRAVVATPDGTTELPAHLHRYSTQRYDEARRVGAAAAGPAEALTGLGFGVLPAEVRFTVDRGDRVLHEVAEWVRAAKGPLRVKMSGFEDSTAPARELLEALKAHRAQPGPLGAPQSVVVVTDRNILPAAQLREELELAGVAVRPASDPSRRNALWNHQKFFASLEGGLFTSAPAIAKASKRVEVLARLPREIGERLFVLEDRVQGHRIGPEERRARLSELAAMGFLVNDPAARAEHVTTAILGLLYGARRRLDIQVDELKDLPTAQLLVARARAGVAVHLRARELDPDVAALFEREKAVDPQLPLDAAVLDHDPTQPMKHPYPHVNLIMADEAVGYVGTAFLWANQLTPWQPSGASMECGVLVAGQPLRELYAELTTKSSLDYAF